MKKNIIYLGVLFVFNLTISNLLALSNDNLIKGNGKIEKEERMLPTFDSIKCNGAFNVNVVCQKDSQSCEVKTDSNLLQYIQTSVEKNVLIISTTKSLETKKFIIISIGVKNLKSLVSSGASEIKITKMDNDSCKLELEGAGDISVVGESKKLSLKMSGASDVKLKDLKTQNTEVEMSGAGSASVYVSEVLNIVMRGAGDLTYYGKPKVNKKITGVGDVISGD